MRFLQWRAGVAQSSLDLVEEDIGGRVIMVILVNAVALVSEGGPDALVDIAPEGSRP